MIVAVRTDTSPMAAKVVETFGHPAREHAPGRGNLEILPNGNAFAGWWNNSRFSEHAPDGRLLMEAQLRSDLRSYRSYKFPWVGRPQRAPDVYSMALVNNAHVRGHRHAKGVVSDVTTHVFVSWNGATEVAYWSLYRADERGHAADLLSTTSRTGFETKITYRGYASHVVVKAFDQHDVLLGESYIVETIWPTNVHVAETISPTHEDVVETSSPTTVTVVETISPIPDVVETSSPTNTHIIEATFPMNTTGIDALNEGDTVPEPSDDSLQTKLQDLLLTPATTYFLVIIPWVCLVAVSFVLGFLRARAGYTRWWWMRQDHGNRQYESVEQLDLEEERDDSELEEKDIEGRELRGRSLRSDAG